MVGLILLFLICRAFYRMAKGHGKTAWRYAVSGYIAFYVWTFLSYMLFVSFIQLWQPEAMGLIPPAVIHLISGLVGLMMCGFYYSNLKMVFQKPRSFTHNVWRID